MINQGIKRSQCCRIGEYFNEGWAEIRLFKTRFGLFLSPYVSRIVEIEGRKLLDGGVADSIPIEAARKMGFSKNIVVLTQPKGYQKKPQSIKLAKLFYKKYPKFIEAIARRHEIYNKTLEQIEHLEQAGDIFLIRPSKDLQIKRVEKDPARLQEQYDLGYSDAMKAIEELKGWIERSKV